MADEVTKRDTEEAHDNTEEFDSIVKRDRIGRWSFFVLCVTAALFGPAVLILLLSLIIFPLDPVTSLMVIIANVLIGGHFFSYWVPNFFISVPQVQGFVTLNPLLSTFGIEGDPNIIYGPGLHFGYPWEQRSRKSNFSLEVFTLPFKEEVPGKETRLLVTGSYQYQVDLKLSVRFIGIDEATISGGALDLIKARISTKLANQTGDEAKADIEKDNEELYVFFGIGEKPMSDTEAEHLPTNRNQRVANFEKRYGLKTKAVTISGIDLPEDVQKTRDAIDEAAQVLKGVANMYGTTVEALEERIKDGSLKNEELNEMIDRFAAFSGNAEMKINAIKLHGVSSVIEAALAAAKR